MSIELSEKETEVLNDLSELFKESVEILIKTWNLLAAAVKAVVNAISIFVKAVSKQLHLMWTKDIQTKHGFPDKDAQELIDKIKEEYARSQSDAQLYKLSLPGKKLESESKSNAKGSDSSNLS